MPRSPTANWNRHQYKKAAMLVYVIAARAGSRGNVGKLSPSQGAANPIKKPAFGNSILRFPDFSFCDAKTGVGQDITDLTAAVQLRLRVANTNLQFRFHISYGWQRVLQT
jgi:hypothetical protein